MLFIFQELKHIGSEYRKYLELENGKYIELEYKNIFGSNMKIHLAQI
jgi:hypothetical protein